MNIHMHTHIHPLLQTHSHTQYTHRHTTHRQMIKTHQQSIRRTHTVEAVVESSKQLRNRPIQQEIYIQLDILCKERDREAEIMGGDYFITYLWPVMLPNAGVIFLHKEALCYNEQQETVLEKKYFHLQC